MRVFRLPHKTLVITPQFIVLFFLGLIIAVTAGVAPQFFRTANLFNVLRQSAALGILSIGQTVVVVGGGVDLSVGSTMQLAGVTIAEVTKGENNRLPTGVAFGCAIGIGIGVLNGFLIAYRNIEPFVATLFVGLLGTGLRLWVTKATPSGVLPPALRILGRGALAGVPNIVILFIGLALGVSFILNRSVYGRKLYAVGANLRAAFVSGVRVKRILLFSYILCGFLSAVAGIALVSYLGYADQEIGVGYDLDSIAAVVIGGASLGGGKGTVLGTVFGVLLMAVLNNLVLLLNLKIEHQLILRGGVIVLGVALYTANWAKIKQLWYKNKGGEKQGLKLCILNRKKQKLY